MMNKDVDIVNKKTDLYRSEKNKQTKSDASSFLAYNYAKDFVKAKLKSPSTAEFPIASEQSKHINKLSNGSYKINSWVDSQNGFGATIRTKFSCIIIVTTNSAKCKNLILEK